MRNVIHHHLLAAAFTLGLAACTVLTDPGFGDGPNWPSPGQPGNPGNGAGYVETDRGSWTAWHNVMPGATPRLHVEGTVTVASASHRAELQRRPSTPDSLHFDVTVRDTGQPGAQVLTSRDVKYSAPYDGNHHVAHIHLPDGRVLELDITRAH